MNEQTVSDPDDDCDCDHLRTTILLQILAKALPRGLFAEVDTIAQFALPDWAVYIHLGLNHWRSWAQFRGSLTVVDRL